MTCYFCLFNCWSMCHDVEASKKQINIGDRFVCFCHSLLRITNTKTREFLFSGPMLNSFLKVKIKRKWNNCQKYFVEGVLYDCLWLLRRQSSKNVLNKWFEIIFLVLVVFDIFECFNFINLFYVWWNLSTFSEVRVILISKYETFNYYFFNEKQPRSANMIDTRV